jgi:hypothetical protein
MASEHMSFGSGKRVIQDNDQKRLYRSRNKIIKLSINRQVTYVKSKGSRFPIHTAGKIPVVSKANFPLM